MKTLAIPLYEPSRQRDGMWKPTRSRGVAGGHERIEWPFSTHGACVVVCAILNEELKHQAEAIVASYMQGRF